MAVAHPAVFVAGVAVGMVVQLMLLRRRQSALGHAKGSPPEQPPSVAAGSQGSSHERLAHVEAPVTPGTARKLSRPPSLNTLMLRADTRKDLHASVQTLGILVHGCHLQADGWEFIVWGQPPDQLGRLPHACLLAWEERSTLRRIICGTGASQLADGTLEADVTVDFLWARLPRLREFDGFEDVDLVELEVVLRRTVRAERTSQNTTEEVREALSAFQGESIRKAVLVSSPTHLPRCLACAGKIHEEQPNLFDGSVWASPSGTSYHGAHAGDLVVVEPPHRGDRDKTLDALPFHEMVRRYYAVAPERRLEFLREFETLLGQYGV